MGVDFSGVVLAPCMEVFAISVTFDPLRSQRNNPVQFVNRGIWSQRAIDVITMDGAAGTDVRTTLGIRDADFITTPVPTAQDRVLVHGSWYYIDDVDPDGQGGTTLKLRLIIE